METLLLSLAGLFGVGALMQVIFANKQPRPVTPSVRTVCAVIYTVLTVCILYAWRFWT
mgnify:CR=1 FL=1